MLKRSYLVCSKRFKKICRLSLTRREFYLLYLNKISIRELFRFKNRLKKKIEQLTQDDKIDKFDNVDIDGDENIEDESREENKVDDDTKTQFLQLLKNANNKETIQELGQFVKNLFNNKVNEIIMIQKDLYDLITENYNGENRKIIESIECALSNNDFLDKFVSKVEQEINYGMLDDDGLDGQLRSDDEISNCELSSDESFSEGDEDLSETDDTSSLISLIDNSDDIDFEKFFSRIFEFKPNDDNIITDPESEYYGNLLKDGIFKTGEDLKENGTMIDWITTMYKKLTNKYECFKLSYKYSLPSLNYFTRIYYTDHYGDFND